MGDAEFITAKEIFRIAVKVDITHGSHLSPEFTTTLLSSYSRYLPEKRVGNEQKTVGSLLTVFVFSTSLASYFLSRIFT